jgi:NifU-like protein involved in Fe-S cluster formation
VRQGKVLECRFRAYGCPQVIAAASWVAEHAEGRRTAELDWVDPHALAQLLDAPAYKLGSLLVVEDAYRACMTGASEA